MQSFSSPFDFPSPFVINEQNNQLFIPTTVDSTLVANNNSLIAPIGQTVTNPPTYESVCNGTSRSVMLNNQSPPHQPSRNPPPGLVHPTQTDQKMINAAILQVLRKELADAKNQLAIISQINKKIENVEKILVFFERI